MSSASIINTLFYQRFVFSIWNFRGNWYIAKSLTLSRINTGTG